MVDRLGLYGRSDFAQYGALGDDARERVEGRGGLGKVAGSLDCLEEVAEALGSGRRTVAEVRASLRGGTSPGRDAPPRSRHAFAAVDTEPEPEPGTSTDSDPDGLDDDTRASIDGWAAQAPADQQAALRADLTKAHKDAAAAPATEARFPSMSISECIALSSKADRR